MFEQLAAASGEELPGELGDGTVEMVADGDTFYMRSPLFEMFTGTTGWLSMSAEELGTGAGEPRARAPAPPTPRRSSSRSAGSPASPRWSGRRTSAASTPPTTAPP